MRLVLAPVPRLVVCNACRTEWNVTQKDCPALVTICKLCKRGRIKSVPDHGKR